MVVDMINAIIMFVFFILVFVVVFSNSFVFDVYLDAKFYCGLQYPIYVGDVEVLVKQVEVLVFFVLVAVCPHVDSPSKVGEKCHAPVVVVDAEAAKQGVVVFVFGVSVFHGLFFDILDADGLGICLVFGI